MKYENKFSHTSTRESLDREKSRDVAVESWNSTSSTYVRFLSSPLPNEDQTLVLNLHLRSHDFLGSLQDWR